MRGSLNTSHHRSRSILGTRDTVSLVSLELLYTLGDNYQSWDNASSYLFELLADRGVDVEVETRGIEMFNMRTRRCDRRKGGS